MTELPNIAVVLFDIPTASKLLTLEAQRLLQAMGAETRVFDPAGLPQPDGAPDSHAKVQELRELAVVQRRESAAHAHDPESVLTGQSVSGV